MHIYMVKREHVDLCLQGSGVLSVHPGVSLSDHTEVVIEVGETKPPIYRWQMTIRKLTTISDEDFLMGIREMHTDILGISDVNELAVQYKSRLSQILEETAPMKTVTVTQRPQFPWYTCDTAQQKRNLRDLEKRWKRTGNASDRINYTQARNRYARHLKYNQRNIVTQQVLECDKDSKKLYALLNKLTCTVDNNPMLKVGDLSTLPDKFADFFF